MGTMHSLYGTAFALGIACGPIVGAVALETSGVAVHGFASAAVALLAAGLFLMLERPVVAVAPDPG
jgi:predicted MFS family arabinose efflux permease